MKNIYTTLAILLLTAVTAVAQTHIHLSPHGNDSNKGTATAPMRTLQTAINMAISTTAKDTAYIEVAPGHYPMQQSCRITAPNKRPIVIRSTNGKARFIGGRRVYNWEHTPGNRYRAYIPEAKDNGYTFEQFFVNGRRATLARTPNSGFYHVQQVTETVSDSGKSTRESYASLRIEAENGKELEHVWPGENGRPKASFYHKWSNSKLHIDVINKTDNTFNIGGKRLPPLNTITAGTPYYLYDYAHALDAQGEWYMDYESGYLTYIPLAGERLENAECYIPTTGRWVELTGNKNGYIENIMFEGITFEVSKFSLPRTGYYPTQAATTADGAIELNFTKNISFNNCTFKSSGGYAIWIKEQSHGTTVRGCYIHDCGAGGIRIGLTTYKNGESITSGNTIDNNIIKECGKEIAEGVGIAIHHSADNNITHNDISYLFYSGISMGWRWGYGASPACNNTIAYNHIHHIGNGILSDLGGIYTLGEGTGNTIKGNVIHDIEAASYGGWGIYTDEGSSNIEITENLVYRCHDGAFHQHYGKNNTVENNIFAFGNNCQMQTSRAEAHNSFTFRRNIILQERGETAKGQWFTANMEINKNLYWSYGDSLIFCGRGATEWSEKREKGATFKDPLMNNPQAGDFTFKSKKTIKKIGFKPFDYNKAGVYGSDEWQAKAEGAK